MDPSEPKSFYVADWWVDVAANRLRRDDAEVRLEGKVMAVLAYLAEHAGEAVDRETLEQVAWGHTVIGYDALTSCIAKLRKALQDDPREPRFIETIPKKGYRLIAGVTRGTAQGAYTPLADVARPRLAGRRLWLAGVGLLLVAGVGIALNVWRGGAQRQPPVATDATPTIVVFPFATLGDARADYRYFSEGITADITTALSRLSGLLVISHASASQWQGEGADATRAAGALGARYVLNGDVRRTPERVRVNVRLIDAHRNVYLWSEKYDRQLRDIFALQDDISAKVAAALSVTLTAEEKKRTAHRYTTSLEAYDDFQRAQAFYFRHTREDNSLAREHYQLAIDRDPGFARAYSAMALTHVADHRYGWVRAPAQTLDRALVLARKGIALNRESPRAYWVLGYVHLFRREYRQAADAADKAIALEPSYADSYVTLAVSKMHFGQAREALRLLRKAMLLNPHYPAAYASVQGQAYFVVGDYEAAVAILRKAIERNIQLRSPHVFLISALSKLDRLDEARWSADQLLAVAPDFSSERVADMVTFRDAAVLQDLRTQLRRVGL